MKNFILKYKPISTVLLIIIIISIMAFICIVCKIIFSCFKSNAFSTENPRFIASMICKAINSLSALPSMKISLPLFFIFISTIRGRGIKPGSAKKNVWRSVASQTAFATQTQPLAPASSTQAMNSRG